MDDIDLTVPSIELGTMKSYVPTGGPRCELFAGGALCQPLIAAGATRVCQRTGGVQPRPRTVSRRLDTCIADQPLTKPLLYP